MAGHLIVFVFTFFFSGFWPVVLPPHHAIAA